MMHEILCGIMGGVVLLAIGLVLGLITGTFIVGNYLTGFEFGGMRGYEVFGNFEAIIGGVIGV